MFGNISSTPLKTAHGDFTIAVLPEEIPLGMRDGERISTFVEPYALVPHTFNPEKPATIYVHYPDVVDDVFRYRTGKRYPIQSRILRRLARGENSMLLYIDRLSSFDRIVLTKGLEQAGSSESENEQAVIARFRSHFATTNSVSIKHTRKSPFKHPDYPGSFLLKTDLAHAGGIKEFSIQPFFESAPVNFPTPALSALFPQMDAKSAPTFIKILRHYAIIANAPKSRMQLPLVRVHSSCCTGDFNGSLQCDCGPQLRKALKRVAESGYGAVIYHDSEGRGIHSLALKMELYKLHAAGVADTYGSMHQFGYADDMRIYDSAVELLENIGMLRVELLTNNPTKIQRLSAAGLDIVRTSQIGIDLTKADAATHRYITAKIEQGGHTYTKAPTTQEIG